MMASRLVIAANGNVTEIEMTEAESSALAAERLPVAANSDQVNAERDRRIAAGFVFGGKTFDSRPEDQKRISGAATMAFMAKVAGAATGDLRWHGGSSDFAWIAQDNSLVTMDADTVINFGKTAAAWETAHIFAARALKDMVPVPFNFAAPANWP